MTHIDWRNLSGRYTYTAFRQLTDELMAEGKTTGDNHSDAMLEYTRMNVVRMNRLDKKTTVAEAVQAKLAAIDRPLVWLTITEAWCGDAAQIIPVLQKMADQQDHIDQYLILRDEHLDIMDAFLTNGARSIPVTIVIAADTNEVLGHWGPRPNELQTQVMDAKLRAQQAPDEETSRAIAAAAKVDVQRWYARDKTMSTQMEMIAAVVNALERQ